MRPGTAVPGLRRHVYTRPRRALHAAWIVGAGFTQLTRGSTLPSLTKRFWNPCTLPSGPTIYRRG